MRKNDSRRDGGFSINAPVTGSAIASNSTMKNVTITAHSNVSSADLKDLREAIALLLTQIDAARGSEADDNRIRYELQTIGEELGEDEPDGAAVQSRWKQVQKLLKPLQHVASIAASADRIFTLIHTLFAAG